MSCNCNGDQCNSEDQESTETIYLTLEDGNELKCEVVSIFEVEMNKYIALLPERGETVFLYKYEGTEEGPELSTIEDDNEYKRVSEVYNKMMKAETKEKE